MRFVAGRGAVTESHLEDVAGQGAAKCGVEALRAKRGAREAEHYAPLLPTREWEAKKKDGPTNADHPLKTVPLC